MFENIMQLIESQEYECRTVDENIPFASKLAQVYLRIVYNIRLEVDEIGISFSALNITTEFRTYQAEVVYFQKDRNINALAMGVGKAVFVAEDNTCAKALQALISHLQSKLNAHLRELFWV